MKYVFKVLRFGYPLKNYFPEYILYTIIYVVFGLVNFAMLIPMLDVLFNVKEANEVTVNPTFELSIHFVIQKLYYLIYHISNSYGKMFTIIFMGGLLLSANLLSNLFRYLSLKTILRLRINVLEKIRSLLYNKILSHSFLYHKRTRRGELMSSITHEINQIDICIMGAIKSWAIGFILVVAYFSYLFYISYQLTLATLIFLPVGGYFISKLIKKLRTMGKSQITQTEKLVNFIEESFASITLIQSHTAINFMTNKFDKINHSYSNINKTTDLRRELATPVSEFLGMSMVVSLLCFGGYLIFNQQSNITASAFISYLIAYSQIISPLKSLSSSASQLQRGIIACEKIFGIVEATPEIENVKKPIIKHTFEDCIVFEDVCFGYNSKNKALQSFNLTIKRGESVALVGASGSGKTTVSYLLSRFIDPNSGNIYIDGINIKDIDIDCTRNLISYIAQEPLLFYDTIANNVAFSSTNNNDTKAIRQSLDMANATDFIDKLPDKEQAIVGERGMNLSGGERQRIAIARAIHKNAPIFVMDEPTSALDSKSEDLVKKALAQITKERTSLIIAHRLSTIKDVDKIIVMRNGLIVESGTHKELISSSKGYYRSLVDIQQLS